MPEGRLASTPLVEHPQDFLDYLRLNRNASPHTVLAYDTDLTQLVAFLAAGRGAKRRDVRADQLDYAAVRGFLASLHARGDSRATAARKLAAVRAFTRYLRHEGVLDEEPASRGGLAEAREEDSGAPRGRGGRAPARDTRMSRGRSGGGTGPSWSSSTRRA